MKWLCGPDETVSRARFGPRAVVWRPCHTRTKYSAGTDKQRRYGRSDDTAEVVIAEF